MTIADFINELSSRNDRVENRRDLTAGSMQQMIQQAAAARVQGMGGAGGRNRRAPVVGGGGGLGNVSRDAIRVPGKGWGKDHIPEVSDIGKLRPHGPLTTIKDFQGHKVTVNKQVAPIFRSFLKDLKRTGYNINSIGGYANRAITGGTAPSLHSYGFAIDINPAQNPYQANDGSMQTNMRRAVMRRLSRKYGLQWGGDWHGNKDPMHFSVAYGGRE